MTLGTVETVIGIVTGFAAICGIIKRLLKRQHEETMEMLHPIREAAFFSLQAHVENGANGDVKKAYERLKDNIFKEKQS